LASFPHALLYLLPILPAPYPRLLRGKGG
jgi:hypothetical protein